MKKKLLPLAIAAAMAPGFAAAADVSGFGDINYVVTDDAANVPGAKNPNEGKFGTNAELDFTASPADGVTFRSDVDLSLTGNGTIGANNGGGANASGATGGPTDSGSLEQAFFAWGATEGVTVIGGVFNDPIGYEAEDVNDRTFMHHDVVYNILDQQTTLKGDNVAGLAVAGAVGPVTLTGAMLNDLQQTNGENSFALVANYSPIKGLDLELGSVSQASSTKNANSAETVTDFNVAYSPEQVAGLMVGLDYLTAGKIVDSAYSFFVSYDIGHGLGVAARAENVSWNSTAAAVVGTQDSKRTTFNVSYQVASNLKAVLENANGDSANPVPAVTGIMKDNSTTLNLVATF